MKRFRRLMLRLSIFMACVACCGCSLLPQMVHKPSLHNPFPQLSRVAIAPFFNLSSEPTVDGRKVALAYYNELQLVPGFEVVPVGVVEQAMRDHQIELSDPHKARRLAQLLGVDAVVIGAVTDYSAYYPPRCAIQVEWYAANVGFHPIPAGYGLPWGTPQEKEIPASLVFEAEFALAKEQLKAQSPDCRIAPVVAQPPTVEDFPNTKLAPNGTADSAVLPSGPPSIGVGPSPTTPSTTGVGNDAAMQQTALAAGCPSPGGAVPPFGSQPPTCWPSDAPVLKHTQTYNGHDVEFTAALASYYSFREDARFGGWQSYLQRSEDFIRFCCHMHIWEMLSARGGAGETRVVWRCSGVR